MNHKVVVYHNVAFDGDRPLGMLDGYARTHPVVAVWRGEIDADTDNEVCNRAWFLFNVGDDPSFGVPDPRAVAYRANRNRSLNLGDVLRIDGRFYACLSVGWTQVTEPVISTASVRGSTALAEQEPAS